MPGIIPHIIAGITTGIIIHFFHQKFEFSIVAFIGNLLPDTIKFGITAIFQGTIKIFAVEKNSTYQTLDSLSGNITNWFTLGFFSLALILFLYHYHIIKKKQVEEYSELTGFLILGIITHLIMDLLIIEKGPWF